MVSVALDCALSRLGRRDLSGLSVVVIGTGASRLHPRTPGGKDMFCDLGVFLVRTGGGLCFGQGRHRPDLRGLARRHPRS